MREIKVRLFHEHFPVGGTGGICCLDPKTGEYMVIVNADLPQEERAKAFLHEMLHIYNDDFERVLSEGIQRIEADAHEQLDRLSLEA